MPIELAWVLEVRLKLKQYQVDAFTDKVFGGNPAAVVALSSWPEDSLLQAIAEENNLSETAFFVESGIGFKLRWFTPVKEVDLCGHATLATAHVIFNILGFPRPIVTFETRSGELLCKEGRPTRNGFSFMSPNAMHAIRSADERSWSYSGSDIGR